MYSSLADLDFRDQEKVKSRAHIFKLFLSKNRHKIFWGFFYIAIGLIPVFASIVGTYKAFYPEIGIEYDFGNYAAIFFSFAAGILIIAYGIKFLKAVAVDPLFSCFINPSDFEFVQGEIFKAEFRFRNHNGSMDKIRVSARVGSVIVTEEFGQSKWNKILQVAPTENQATNNSKSMEENSSGADAVPCIILYNKNYPKIASICGIEADQFHNIAKW